MSTKQSEGPGKAPRGPLGGLVKKFLDMNLAAKFSLMFSVIVLTVLIFTTLVLADSGQRYLQAEQDARCKQSLEFVRILIEKEQRYMEGLTEYYASSTETQELLALSNAGQPVPEERTQDLLESTRFKMYLLSVVFYNFEGEPIDYVSIDNSHDPLPQSGKGQQKAGKSQIDHRGEDRITAVPRDQESDRDIGADSGREQEPGLVQRDEAEQLVEEDVAPLVIQEPYALQNI